MSTVLKLPGGYRCVCGAGGERQTNVIHVTHEGENHRGSRGTDVQALGQGWGLRKTSEEVALEQRVEGGRTNI